MTTTGQELRLNLATVALIERLDENTAKLTLTMPVSASKAPRTSKLEGAPAPEGEKSQTTLLVALDKSYEIRHLFEYGTC